MIIGFNLLGGENLSESSLVECTHNFVNRNYRLHADKQRFFKALIKEIHIYEEPVGKQWLKSIKFTFPLLGESDEIGLDIESSVETVCLLNNRK